MSRVVSWFSCGAASAVATKLALQANYLPNGASEVVVAYCDTFKREHPDNRRFFEGWNIDRNCWWVLDTFQILPSHWRPLPSTGEQQNGGCS